MGLAKLPFLRGNSVELMVDGDATFASILGGIDAAEDWYSATEQWLDLSWTPAASGEADIPTLILPSGPVDELETANFDNRSFRLNFEITVVVADPDFASQVERMREADFAKSRLMAPGEYDAKPWWFRFAVKLARLTAPVQ